MFTTPEHYQSRISVVSSKAFEFFDDGAYLGSCKIPNLAIVIDDDDKRKIPCIVFEIGLSKSYEHLTQCAKLWLEGMSGVKVCILIKIHENPRYHYPSMDNADFPAFNQIFPSAFKSESEFGPVAYKGLRWTGRISSPFLETWTLARTKLATKSGERMVYHYFYV